MITTEQRTARQKFIGSSDAAAVLGEDPYRSPKDVWYEKTGRAEGFAGNEHTDRGNLLEPVLLTWAERRLGKPLLRDEMRVGGCGLICANFDALVAAGAESVEAKTATDAAEWGEEGTDEIPARHIIQAHHGFAVLPELRVCWVPVLLPGYRSLDFRLYRVDRNDALADAVADRCRHFMDHFVKLGIEPDDSVPSLEVLKRVRREPNKIVPIDDALVDRWIVATAAAKQAEEDRKATQAAVIASLGDAEAGHFAKGSVTYLETKRKEYVVKESCYRTLRLKAAKGS